MISLLRCCIKSIDAIHALTIAAGIWVVLNRSPRRKLSQRPGGFYAMIDKIYKRLLAKSSRREEAGQYSGGVWSAMIRDKAFELSCLRSGRLLEIGCGEGLFLSRLAAANNALQITGIDIDKGRLDLAISNCRQRGLRNVDFILSNRDSFMVAQESFDTAVFINTLFNLNCIGDVEKIFRSASVVLKKDGIFIFDFLVTYLTLAVLKVPLAPSMIILSKLKAYHFAVTVRRL